MSFVITYFKVLVIFIPIFHLHCTKQAKLYGIPRWLAKCTSSDASGSLAHAYLRLLVFISKDLFSKQTPHFSICELC